MEALDVVFTECVRRLGDIGHVVIAGGAVRDHLMGRTPKDFDVFVLGTNIETHGAAVAAALDGWEVVTVLEFHKSEPFLISTVRFDGHLVQVMCSPEPTTSALLDTFDWNVCLFAFDGEFHNRERVSSICEGATLRLQKVTYPLSTLRRGFRFSERFGMKLERDTVIRLCREVVEAKPDASIIAATEEVIA